MEDKLKTNRPDEEPGRVAHIADQARIRGAELLGAAREKVAQGADTLRTKSFDDLLRDGRSYVRNNPGRTVLFSLAAGLVLGMMLRGRRSS